MADEQQKDAKALAEAALAKLRTKGISAACPRCSQPNWNAELLGILVTGVPSVSFSLPPPHAPTIALTCRNCGFMAFHNLKVLGVVP